MFHPRNTRFRTGRRPDPGRYPTRRYVRRLPDLGEAEPEPRTALARAAREQPWHLPKNPPLPTGDPLLQPEREPEPAPPPEQGVGRIIVVSIGIMTVVILWAAWGVARLNDWPG